MIATAKRPNSYTSPRFGDEDGPKPKRSTHSVLPKRSTRSNNDGFQDLRPTFAPGHTMQPNENDCKNLAQFNQKKTVKAFKSMSIEEWLLNKFIIEHLSNSKHRKDLEKRAEKLVDWIIRTGKREITYMDGHGRFTYHLLKLLHEESKKNKTLNINTMIFNVVDIESNVIDWHHDFFPVNFVSIPMDIFEARIMYGSISFVYMNFCGLGGQATEAEKELIKAIKDVQNGNGCAFMVSFSLARSAKTCYPELLSLIAPYERVTERKDFITVIVE